MDELLQQLIESDLLTEETKTQLQKTVTKMLEERTVAIREEVETEVKTELAEKYAKDKEELVEALDTALTKALTSEVEELKEDIERFRDLEAEYAQKLVEHRQQVAEDVKNDMAKLLEGLDAYVDQRFHVEMEELNESIEDVRKENYGRKIIETLGGEYRRMFTDENDLEEQINEKQAQLENATNALKEAQNKLKTVERDQKMEEILESLSGHKREVMAAILDGIPTEKLDEGYRRYIGRVLTESTNKSEKDTSVLAESKESDKNKVLESADVKVVAGDRTPLAEDVSDETTADETEKQRLNEAYKKRLRLLSGIDS